MNHDRKVSNSVDLINYKMETIQAKVQVRRTAGILVAKGRGRYVFNNRSGVTGVSVAASTAWKCA